MGDTGAGKSSMLNALLGEQAILPTSGMRACTASIIEMRYSSRVDHKCESIGLLPLWPILSFPLHSFRMSPRYCPHRSLAVWLAGISPRSSF